jgi:hypothetical protein
VWTRIIRKEELVERVIVGMGETDKEYISTQMNGMGKRYWGGEIYLSTALIRSRNPLGFLDS